MFAGLPGTGIGGIFYLLLTLWMPINELYLTFDGRSSLARWKFIAGRWAIFSLVVLTMWVQVRLFKGFFPQGAPESATRAAEAVGISTEGGSSTWGVLFATGLYAAMVMAAVVAIVHLIRALRFYRVYMRDLIREFA